MFGLIFWTQPLFTEIFLDPKFGQTLFWLEILEKFFKIIILFWAKNFEPKFHLTSNFFGHKNVLDKKILTRHLFDKKSFWHDIFLPKIFVNPIFFVITKNLRSKCFGLQFLFSHQTFLASYFLDLNFFWTQIFLAQHFLDQNFLDPIFSYNVVFERLKMSLNEKPNFRIMRNLISNRTNVHLTKDGFAV